MPQINQSELSILYLETLVFERFFSQPANRPTDPAEARPLSGSDQPTAQSQLYADSPSDS
jgi:hypothetical protein